MINKTIGAFQSKRGIHISPDSAASMLESVSYVLDQEDIKDGRISRLPLRLALGSPVGDYLFVPMTVLDASIALAIDNRPSITPIFSSNLSRCISFTNKDFLLCKIKKQGLKYEDFITVCMIDGGITNFRARCESVICLSEKSYIEISRFVKNKNFNINVSMSQEENKSSHHSFTFASSLGNVVIEDKTLMGALIKFSSKQENGIDKEWLDPSFLKKMLISVDSNNDGISEMRRYVPGGNKIVNIGSKVVAKPTNLMLSKIVGTVIARSSNIIRVKWASGVIKYNLDNPKTYFLIEFVD